MRRLFGSILQCVCVSSILFSLCSKADAVPWLHVEGNNIKNPSGNTVVLRGAATPDLDVAADNFPGIKFVIDRLVNGGDDGFDSRVVRLVIPTERWSSNPDNFFKTVLKPAVDYCVKKDIYCIVDWHGFGDQNGQYTSSQVDSDVRAFWSYVAPKFKDVPNVLYELFNEPEYPADWETWKKTAQPWVDLVRAAAPKNIIIVGSPLWDALTKYASSSPFTGSNLMYAVHIYPGSRKSETDYDKLWDDLFGNAMQSVPVFATEWGYEADDGKNNCSKGGFCGTTSSFGKPLRNYVDKHPNLSWTVWDYGYAPSLIDRNYKITGGENHEGQFAQQWLRDMRNKSIK